MAKTLALLMSALLLQDPKPPAQENPPELKWVVEKDDKFDFKWTFSENIHQKLGVNPPNDVVEKREVEGELSWREGGLSGNILLVIRKASWSRSQREHDISVTYGEGKGPVSSVKMKVKSDPKKPDQNVELLKGRADESAEAMKRIFEGEYTINTLVRPGEAFIARNGTDAGVGAGSIFSRVFLHPKLPKGAVESGQSWKDPPTGIPFPQGLVDLQVVEYKATVGARAVTVKTGGNIPINRPPSNTGEKLTGNFTFAREYSFSRDYYLSSAKEESTFKKKVDAKEKFYEEDATVVMKQEMTIKKRPPAAPPKDAPPKEKQP